MAVGRCHHIQGVGVGVHLAGLGGDDSVADGELAVGSHLLGCTNRNHLVDRRLGHLAAYHSPGLLHTVDIGHLGGAQHLAVGTGSEYLLLALLQSGVIEERDLMGNGLGIGLRCVGGAADHNAHTVTGHAVQILGNSTLGIQGHIQPGQKLPNRLALSLQGHHLSAVVHSNRLCLPLNINF